MDRLAAKALQETLGAVDGHGTTVYEEPFALPPHNVSAQGRTGIIRQNGYDVLYKR
jgi:hypothetical protein